MGGTELVLLALGLSMDAFAVSVCKGLSIGRAKIRHILTAGAWFGGFQALMPALGYILSSHFDKYIKPFDHWAAFILLAGIGANMIRGALGRRNGRDESADASMRPAVMAALAAATSMDALAAGMTFAFLDVRILPAAAIIGAVSFAVSAAGIKAGSRFGAGKRTAAELLGGAVLTALGARILLEHLGII